MKTWKEEFQKADTHLRSGRVAEALALLPKRQKLSRADRLLAANIARRTSQIDLGLQLLHPALFSESQKPTEGEVAEYAVLLELNGGFKEASRWLDSVEQPKLAETFLARAWCLFMEWRFADSIPHLRDYLRLQKDPYFRIAGKINLCEALFETASYQECRMILTELLDELSKTSYARLRANALHIESMLLHALGDLEASDRSLTLAFELLKDFETTDKLLLYRQQAINLATREKDLRVIEVFRRRAKRLSAWSSLRKVDFESLKIEFNQSVFDRLYFGSPFPEFLKLLQSTFPSANAPDVLRWGGATGACLNLTTGQLLSRRGEKWSGQNLALLKKLTQDLYSPDRLGDLFGGLFPGEHYHLVHSPNRVRQSLHRFRLFLEEGHWPLRLHCKGGYYSLKPIKGFSILLPNPHQRASKEDLLERLKVAKKSFTRQDVMDALGLPKASATRLIDRELHEKKIKRTGRGRSSRYHTI